MGILRSWATSIPGLFEFLLEQPDLDVASAGDDGVLLEGVFGLDATHEFAGRQFARYHLRILIPWRFPSLLPRVYEMGEVIPRTPDFHVNLHDGSFCLGSELRLREFLLTSRRIDQFFGYALVPYLYAVTVKLRCGGSFIFGELRHGVVGLLQDVASRLAIPEARAAYGLYLGTLRRRVANKRRCPCDCGRRLSKCATHHRINTLRSCVGRAWLRGQFGSVKNATLPPRLGRLR